MRTSRGGMLSGQQLRAVAMTLIAGQRLRRQVQGEVNSVAHCHPLITGKFMGEGRCRVPQLLPLTCALQLVMAGACRSEDAGNSEVRPILLVVSRLEQNDEVSKLIGTAVDENGGVRDAASPELEKARQRVSGLEGSGVSSSLPFRPHSLTLPPSFPWRPPLPPSVAPLPFSPPSSSYPFSRPPPPLDSPCAVLAPPATLCIPTLPCQITLSP